MKHAAWICLLVALALGAPAASGQSPSSTVVLFGNLEGRAPISTTTVPAQTSGQLTVSFHGDPSTGCASQGICGYSGTVVFRPGHSGDLAVSRYRVHGRTEYQVGLSLPSDVATLTAARVTGVGGGCSDAVQPNLTLPGTVTGGEVAISLIQPQAGILTTRCAGPLDADLAGSGPQIRLSLSQLLRGRGTLSLGGSWSFAAGGFAGTVDSNLAIALGRPATQRPAGQHFPRGFKPQRERQVSEAVSLVRGGGSFRVALGSDPSACQFLGSCGIQGTLDGNLAPQDATGSLFVIGPARRPYADFLAALGLSRKGNPRGLKVGGTMEWAGGGTVTAQLRQGSSCTSTAPLSGGAVILATRGRGLTATYSPIASPRTRCPGPEFEQFLTLASGGLRPAALGQPSFTLHLSGRGPLADDGYTMSQQTSLTLTLRRGRVHERTLLVPAG